MAVALLASAFALDLRPDEATFAAVLAAEDAEDGDFEALNLLQGASALRKVQQRRQTEQQQQKQEEVSPEAQQLEPRQQKETDAAAALQQSLETMVDDSAAFDVGAAAAVSLIQQGATLKVKRGDSWLQHSVGHVDRVEL